MKRVTVVRTSTDEESHCSEGKHRCWEARWSSDLMQRMMCTALTMVTTRINAAPQMTPTRIPTDLPPMAPPPATSSQSEHRMTKYPSSMARPLKPAANQNRD